MTDGQQDCMIAQLCHNDNKKSKKKKKKKLDHSQIYFCTAGYTYQIYGGVGDLGQ